MRWQTNWSIAEWFLLWSSSEWSDRVQISVCTDNESRRGWTISRTMHIIHWWVELCSTCNVSIITNRVSREAKSVTSVRLSLRLSVRLFPLYLLNRRTFEFNFCVWVMTIARLALKVKVVGQGQRSMPSSYGRGNAVTRSVWPRSWIEDDFSSYLIIKCTNLR